VPPDAGGAGEARGGRVCKWTSAGRVAGGLGGNARFTMVSRGPSSKNPLIIYSVKSILKRLTIAIDVVDYCQ